MMRRRLRPLMLGGTGSDVGKSVLAAGFCRIFKQDGYHPAPFKAQNMALNSYVTKDGLELGRAQAVQAEAAGVPCSSDMNPILLKPIGDCTSQVVLHGRPVGNRTAGDYFSAKGRDVLRREVCKAFDRLAERYNPIVMEGAGSIAEINLEKLDIVNMPMAAHAGAAVILAADIRRGGVFASCFGSIMLQKPEYRKLIKGIIVNQFRGDIALFEQGKEMLENLCCVPVVGVMPYLDDLRIEEEDSYFSKLQRGAGNGKIRIAVVQLEHISNFTDFDPLECDPRTEVFYTSNPNALADCDIVVLPGSKATITDLEKLKASGMAQAINDARAAGKTIVGICGGYQMMGRRIFDPEGIEGDVKSTEGLGLLPVETRIGGDKTTRLTEFRLVGSDETCQGYEIHMGMTTAPGDAKPVATIADGTLEGYMADERCFGTYLHGFFENKCVVDRLLAPFGYQAPDTFDYKQFKDNQYDRLASEMRKHIDMELIYKILSEDD